MVHLEIGNYKEKKGVELVSLSENIDTSTLMGRAMFSMIATMAELERGMIIERTQAGLEAARARGRKGGRKPMDPKKVKQALALYDSKAYTVPEITQQTGISKALLYKGLKKRKEKEGV